MRLFVALLPPPEAVAELVRALGAVRRRARSSALRWTEPAGWHFTLAFLGEVPDPARPELDERLARAARRHGPYELRLAGGGRFGDRALWAGAYGDLSGLAHLADSVRAAARRAGAPADEEYGFQPHLTLAHSRDRTRTRARTGEGGRGSGSVDLRPFVEELAHFSGEPWVADRLSLVSSALPRSGTPGEQPRYTVEASWPLGPASGPAAGQAAPEAEPPGADG
jgi:2'-5' RNA ligase